MILTRKWQRSKRCDTGSCVEARLASAGDGVEVRDSKNPDGPILTFTAKEWDVFLNGIRSGEFEIA